MKKRTHLFSPFLIFPQYPRSLLEFSYSYLYHFPDIQFVRVSFSLQRSGSPSQSDISPSFSCVYILPSTTVEQKGLVQDIHFFVTINYYDYIMVLISQMKDIKTNLIQKSKINWSKRRNRTESSFFRSVLAL